MKRGHFITFEGGDGSGKSTQIIKLKEYLESLGYEVVITREPGGTKIGEKIRDLILDNNNTEMGYMTEAMLYAASRAQHVEEIIKPAVDAGKIVICDRFVDSSIAYQGYGRNLGECVETINSFAIGNYMPDMTFLLKLKPELGDDRMRGRKKDRIELEALDFHEAVYRGYEELENKYSRIVGIDATNSIENIAEVIRKNIGKLIMIQE